MQGVSPGECAVRMARAGAPILGVNCLFDPFICLETVRQMKEALDLAGLSPHLMAQPLGFRTPDTGRYGRVTLPEFPFGKVRTFSQWSLLRVLAMEPRQITRWEAARFAREAYQLGVRVIGGCCGVESHHINAMAAELAEERGKERTDDVLSLLRRKAELRGEEQGSVSKEFWWSLQPSTGRPLSTPFCRQPDPALVNKEQLHFTQTQSPILSH